MSNHLHRALCTLVEKGDMILTAEQPWHSLTFAGTQMSFKLTLSGEDHVAIAGKFAEQLSEQIFDIPNHLVADIAVTETIDDESQTRLVIDALLLND